MSSQTHSDFGPNQGFIEDLYIAFLDDPSGVPPQWGELFRRWKAEGRPPMDSGGPEAHRRSDPQTARAQIEIRATSDSRQDTDEAVSTRSDLPPAPLAAARPALTPYAERFSLAASTDPLASGETTRMRGTAKSVAANMDASLSIPTATSFRQVPVKTMFDNRALVNDRLRTTRGGKVSFTHLIAYAVVEALVQMPDMNSSYTLQDGRPAVHRPEHVNFGLAIDAHRPDGSRTLVVPSVKDAELMTFREFLTAYEDLVRRGREGSLGVEDFQGTTVSLTNPGGIGTTQSVPRLMTGQGAIIGVGSMAYPAGFAGTSDFALARMGVSKVLTLTSTYDHRIIQGATSGEFLRLLETKLTGLDGFYDRVFRSLHVPTEPYAWERDVEYNPSNQLGKPARVASLIHSYRSRGHLIADLDPIAFRPSRHPDLSLSSYGLTSWDLDRRFPAGDFMPGSEMTLREVLSQLRSTSCSSIGFEYMHITDPAQRRWFQERLERPRARLTDAERHQILRKLNQAEAFETFLHTKYVGQKRFSLEGGESLIPALDAILAGAARDGLDSVAIAMSHRGRLNVLTNIAGKSYRQIFTEFDGLVDPRGVHGSGDVKYHLGTEGVYTSPAGETTGVYLAANPSHLEAADGVLEGIVRAKQEALGDPDLPIIPILIHGDAAFIGQGVVQETFNLSQLEGYKTGGTIHVIVNNQIGFTTGPTQGRSTGYATDLAKGLQIPILHVNADDPEAVIRCAHLAFEYRNAFHKDVIIDMVCYRRRGHNEGDDPSMTQPVMYSLIDRIPSTRAVYIRGLVGRGQLTEDEARQSITQYEAELGRILEETRAGGASSVSEINPGSRTHDPALTAGVGEAGESPDEEWTMPESQMPGIGMMIGWTSAAPAKQLRRIGRAHTRFPEGFAPHPKLRQLCERRLEMALGNKPIDWGFAELLAFGTLLMEGTGVRLSGEDVARATFVQRHAVLHDADDGREFTPLRFLTENQARFDVWNSPLSEYGVLAFDYGYSLESPETLTIWEAQFGDFANGAQTVIDEFVCSAEQKWGQRSSLVMLLPHGYEGQGPDHSSARIERYLQLAAQDNMWIVQPSTPANYFHLLRTQAYKRPRKPLIAFTPKQLLRLSAASSHLDEFTSGGFQPVIGDSTITDPASVTRVVLCSGRLYYDLAKERERRGDTSTAIIRLEQLYPLPEAEVAEALAQYPNASVTWAQDEPRNQGAWPHLALNLFPSLGRPVRLVSRPESATTAAGRASLHKEQAATLIAQAFEG